MSQPATVSQQLEDAFQRFNELSEQLSGSYAALQARVASLTRELAAARSERLEQLTAKEKLAERLGALLEALPGGVVVLDEDNRICDCNPAARELLGEPLLGETWADVTRRAWSSQAGDTQEVTLRDGRRITLSTRHLANGQGRILLLQDVTETRALQEQVDRRRRLSMMGEMMARLAHQVRTPLATSLLYASQLNKAHLQPDQRDRFAACILDGLHHLDRMVNDMLLFARGGGAGSESVSLPELLEQVRQSLAPRLQALRAGWHVTADGDVAVVGNAETLASALTNLAANALNACGEGARLEWCLDTQGDEARLVLADNGPGIPEDIRERIFEPFFTTRSSGTGLGLAVVRAIVEAHGGCIRLADAASGGACFIMRLPRDGVPQQMPSELLGQQQTASLNKLRCVR